MLFKDKESFKKVFEENYNPLCNYIFHIIQDRNAANDIIQETFILLWRQRDNIKIESSQSSYLYKAAKNKALEYLRSKKSYQNAIRDAALDKMSNSDAEKMSSQYSKLEKIHSSLRHLPPKCRKVFVLHKFNGLTYAEIADKESISVNTVENHMVKAFKILREILNKEKI